jgi:septal ring factor EnvC (AmiA/AmiB activator)
VVASTREGKTHDQVLAAWDEEYPTFEWEATEQPTEGASTALVSVAALQAAQALMMDAQRREQEARERIQSLLEHSEERERRIREQEDQKAQGLREELNQLQRELGRLEGELTALKYKRNQSWWARIWGVE